MNKEDLLGKVLLILSKDLDNGQRVVVRQHTNAFTVTVLEKPVSGHRKTVSHKIYLTQEV